MMDHAENAEVTAETMSEKTIIASSFTFEGELEANEDTLIQGRVEGSILAESNTVRIGATGQVKGQVFAKRVIVEGKVSGQLSATEKILLEQTADVKGKILAPQVGIEEGCQFNGEVKMGKAAASAALSRARRKQ
jgi:cytoskeletal protein CcmA (bactofilin family)